MVCTELAVSLHSFVHGPSKETQIKESKELVLNTYYRHSSGSVDVANNEDCDHVQKISRVYQTLCESIRHPGQILAMLFERRAMTQQEQDSIRSQTNLYQWTSHLLDLLSAKPASAYKCFLEALDATQQHHLRLLLDEKGYFIHYLIMVLVNFFKYKSRPSPGALVQNESHMTILLIKRCDSYHFLHIDV